MREPKIFQFADIPPALTADAEQLIAEFLAQTAPVHEDVSPRFVHLCGIPGSGKTTYAEAFCMRAHGYALVQFDGVMERLTGYQSDRQRYGPVVAFENWELPARAIGYHLLQTLLESRRNVLFDHSAYCRDHITVIHTAKRWGYSVEMHRLQCPVPVCVQRVAERETRSGRHTPGRLIAEREKLLAELIPLYKEVVDRFVEVEQNDAVVHFIQAPMAIPN